MPRSARIVNWTLLLCLTFWPLPGATESYPPLIRQAELIATDDNQYLLETQIDYQLSPVAKEALHKGVPLTWLVLVEIREIGRLWDSTIYSQKLPYRLRFHALLNQYEVLTPNNQAEMFLTLNAALGFLTSLRGLQPIPAELFAPGHRYKLAMKCLFDRESLPVPLRPFAYLDTQWFLSSDWYIWPIRK